jgi:tRNA(fMet)-specific endonuclease VapC
MNVVSDIIKNGSEIIIPPMVYYEIKRGLIYLNATAKLIAFKKLCSSDIGIMDDEILDIAISIYIDLQTKGKLIGDADILIAAYCIKHNLTLVTNNAKHFKNIDNLQIERWTVE